ALGQLGDSEIADLGPAFDRDTALPGIDTDDDAPGKALAGLAHEGGILDRDGAQDHAIDANLEPTLDALEGTDAAAQLDRQTGRGKDRLDERLVHRAAGKGAVEIDQMQPLEAGGGEGLG